MLRGSGVATAGEARIETALERVLGDPLRTFWTMTAVAVGAASGVSGVSVSAVVTAVACAGLAMAASVLGVCIRAEAEATTEP